MTHGGATKTVPLCRWEIVLASMAVGFSQAKAWRSALVVRVAQRQIFYDPASSPWKADRSSRLREQSVASPSGHHERASGD